METILIILVGLVIATPIAIWVTSIQYEGIKICFDLRSTQDKLLVGELKIEDISDELLLRLRLPKFTHVGVGGVGPAYNPSFALWCKVDDELKRRRTVKASDSPVEAR